MTKEIYTGSKENCKKGNLILINESSDDSKYRVIDKLNFNEELVESLPDIDSGMQEIIKSFYCSELYYNKVLKHIDPIELLDELGDNPILVSSKESKEFDYRHLVALYLELFLGIKSKEILIDEKGNMIQHVLKSVKANIEYEENDSDESALASQFIKPFDLEKPPLIRIKLIKRKNADFRGKIWHFF